VAREAGFDRRLAALLAAIVVAVGALSAAHVTVLELPVFAPSGELSDGVRVPAIVSGLLLAAAAVLALVAAARTSLAGPERLCLVVLALVFAFFAVDELIAIHEDVDEASSLARAGYLATLAAGGFTGAVLWLRRRERGFRIVWGSGAAAWALSQVLDALHANTGDTGFDISGAAAGLEEVLEMAGSALFVLALEILTRRERTAA
jgi:hypothetical protein